jgi:hypothetical protein
MQIGTREDSSAIQMQATMIIASLNEGFYVSVADDSGPKAAYCKSNPTLESDVSHILQRPVLVAGIDLWTAFERSSNQAILLASRPTPLSPCLATPLPPL